MMFWAPSDKACLKSGVHNINAQQGGLMAADARSGRCILYAGAAYIIQSSKYPKYNIQSSPPKYPSRSDGWIPSRTPMQWHKSGDVDVCRDLGVRSLKLLFELSTYTFCKIKKCGIICQNVRCSSHISIRPVTGSLVKRMCDSSLKMFWLHSTQFVFSRCFVSLSRRDSAPGLVMMAIC